MSNKSKMLRRQVCLCGASYLVAALPLKEKDFVCDKCGKRQTVVNKKIVKLLYLGSR